MTFASGTTDYWHHLVSNAMLGTDRRDPPPPPGGPFAELSADDERSTAADRLVQQVAAVAVVRRAGLVAGPPLAPLGPPVHDERRVTPPSASLRWRQIVTRWPVLEDEWLAAVIAGGWRLSPELVAPLLRRHRTHPARTARVLAAAGPLGSWLAAQLPELAPSGSGGRTIVGGASLTELPDLPIPADLVPLLRASDDEIVAQLCDPVLAGHVPGPHLAALSNLVARLPAGSLAIVAQCLETHPLGQLAAARAAMLAELNPPSPVQGCAPTTHDTEHQ